MEQFTPKNLTLETLNKVVEGFKFNVAWLLSAGDVIRKLQEGHDLQQLFVDNPDEYKKLIKPLSMMLIDCATLAKEQGALDEILETNPTEPQPQSSEPTQEGD